MEKLNAFHAAVENGITVLIIINPQNQNLHDWYCLKLENKIRALKIYCIYREIYAQIKVCCHKSRSRSSELVED